MATHAVQKKRMWMLGIHLVFTGAWLGATLVLFVLTWMTAWSIDANVRAALPEIVYRALIGLALAQELDQWLKGRLFVLQPTILAAITILLAVLVVTLRKRWVPSYPWCFPLST